MIHPILKHQRRLAQMNCSPSLCLNYTGCFRCLVQVLVSHCISALRALTALMSLGTWPQGLPTPCPDPRNPFQPTRSEEGGLAISSGGEKELGTQRSARSPTRVAFRELEEDQWCDPPCGQELPSCHYSRWQSCGGGEPSPAKSQCHQPFLGWLREPDPEPLSARTAWEVTPVLLCL